MPDKTPWKIVIAAVALGAALGSLATFGVLRGHRDHLVQPDREAMVHEMGGEVMPFDLDKTTHIFEMTDSGGIQDVVAKDTSDNQQIELIRRHLEHEAARFGSGDFSDPAMLHGKSMPGLAELSAGSDRLRVEYVALPDGGRILYSTHDPRLITAVHRWFGAQLSDHGPDATYR